MLYLGDTQRSDRSNFRSLFSSTITLKAWFSMLKKTLAVAGIAGLLLLGGASAASADYTIDENITSTGGGTTAPGDPVVITFSGIPDELTDDGTVEFAVTGGPGGATLSSLVFASAAGATVSKTVVGGSASATFVSETPGTFTISLINPPSQVIATTTVVVAVPAAAGGAGSGSGASGGLPATGGTVPVGAIWLGVGAIGIGGIAVVAGVARRRARHQH